MSFKVTNRDSDVFVVLRPGPNGNVVGRYNVPAELPVEVGDESDTEDDLHIVELPDESELGKYPLNNQEPWFVE